MIRQTFYLFLFLPFTLSAQTEENLIQLNQRRNFLAAEISKLQDSIQNIDLRLKKLKEEQQKQKQQEIEVEPEIPRIRVQEDSSIMSSPYRGAEVVVEVKKGMMLQIIDRTNKYYLVCFRGNCGYLPDSVLVENKRPDKDLEGEGEN